MKCSTLISTADEPRCYACNLHRKVLKVILCRERRKNPSNSVIKPNSNYRFMDDRQLKRVIFQLREDNRDLKKEVLTLKEKVDNLMNSAIEQDNELTSDYLKIISDNKSYIESSMKNNAFLQLFWDEQMKATQCTTSSNIRWHPIIIRWCLYLRHKSSASYEALHESGILKLPSQRTLRDYTHHLNKAMVFKLPMTDNC